VHQLAPLIHNALPHLSFRLRALIDALLLAGGSVGTAQELADRLGFQNRFCLARVLARAGLPPVHRLSGWITVLHWTWAWEREGVSLPRAALRAGREPPACYRLVRRVTGAPWAQVRQAGAEWVLARFLEQCAVSDTEPTTALERAIA